MWGDGLKRRLELNAVRRLILFSNSAEIFLTPMRWVRSFIDRSTVVAPAAAEFTGSYHLCRLGYWDGNS